MRKMFLLVVAVLILFVNVTYGHGVPQLPIDLKCELGYKYNSPIAETSLQLLMIQSSIQVNTKGDFIGYIGLNSLNEVIFVKNLIFQLGYSHKNYFMVRVKREFYFNDNFYFCPLFETSKHKTFAGLTFGYSFNKLF